MDGATTPIITWLEEHGGIQSKKKAGTTSGGEYEQSGGVRRYGAYSKLIYGDAMPADVAVTGLVESGLMPEGSTADDLWVAIDKEIDGAKKAVAREEALGEDERLAAQYMQEFREATSKGTGKILANTADMQVGQILDAGQSGRFIVDHITENGDVALVPEDAPEDGLRAQIVGKGESLYLAKPIEDGMYTPFSIASEPSAGIGIATVERAVRMIARQLGLEKVLPEVEIVGDITEKPTAANYSIAKRTVQPGNLPDNLAKVIRSTQRLKRQPEFLDAKKGDFSAARKIVLRVLKPAAVEKVRESLKPGIPVVFVPVVHLDPGPRVNAIPIEYAAELADRLGGTVESGIGKISGRANTNAAIKDRFSNEQRFAGPVQKGVQYVIVDDTVTSGDTFISLLEHIKNGGGTVSAITALADGQLQSDLRPRPDLVAKVLDRAEVDSYGFERELGFPITQLTGGEIYRLANLDRGWKGIGELRARILAAGSGEGSGGTPETRGSGPVTQSGFQFFRNTAGQIEGYFDPRTGKTVLNASAISSPKRAMEVFLHEVVGHGGMSAALQGINPKGYENLKRLLQNFKREDGSSLWNDVQERYPNASEATHFDEALARLAENPARSEREESLFKRIVDAIRQWLAQKGFSNWTAAAVDALIRRSAEGLRQRKEFTWLIQHSGFNSPQYWLQNLGRIKTIRTDSNTVNADIRYSQRGTNDPNQIGFNFDAPAKGVSEKPIDDPTTVQESVDRAAARKYAQGVGASNVVDATNGISRTLQFTAPGRLGEGGSYTQGYLFGGPGAGGAGAAATAAGKAAAGALRPAKAGARPETEGREAISLCLDSKFGGGTMRMPSPSSSPMLCLDSKFGGGTIVAPESPMRIGFALIPNSGAAQ